MKIIFLTMSWTDDLNNRTIYSDLINHFVKNGHELFILSAHQRKFGKPKPVSIQNEYKVYRIVVGNFTKTKNLERFFSLLRIKKLMLKGIKQNFKDIKFDLLLYHTPPIAFLGIIKYFKKKYKLITYLLLKDIFPQNAVDLKVLDKKSLFYLYFRVIEKNLYKNSDYIGCMSNANVDFLRKNNPKIPIQAIEVCPNSIEPKNFNITEIMKINIKEKYFLPKDKTIFIYGGNLGKPQGIDFIIECLMANEYSEKSYFLIVGSGTEMGRLELFFKNENPKNSSLLSYLNKTDYEILANSCDVGLIFLDNNFTIPNFPSRILTYMEASMPVLAATDINTDIGRVIENGKFGYWCESRDTHYFFELVNKLCNTELRLELGKNSRDFLENYYTVQNSYKIIMNHFEKDK